MCASCLIFQLALRESQPSRAVPFGPSFVPSTLFTVAKMSSNTTSLFGQVLGEARKQRGLSPAALAAARELDCTFISQLELDKKHPFLLTLYQLGSGLRIAPSVLLRRVEKALKVRKAA